MCYIKKDPIVPIKKYVVDKGKNKNKNTRVHLSSTSAPNTICTEKTDKIMRDICDLSVTECISTSSWMSTRL